MISNSFNSLVEVQALSKSYGGVTALKDVDLTIASGSIHGLCGENGAGKSTLIKCLSGVVTPNSGSITIAGQVLQSGNVRSSELAGVAVMHQESTAFPDLNVLDNIFVGREITKMGGWLLDRRRMMAEARRILKRLGQDLPLNRPVQSFSIAQRQMVSMARAISNECRLLIMDEPTASLSRQESELLMHLACTLKDEGVSILYVSHRLDEIFTLTDHVSVLRDGRMVTTQPTAELDHDQLIRHMVGRGVSPVSRQSAKTVVSATVEPPDPSKPSLVSTDQENKIELSIKGLSARPHFHDINLVVRRGEVVGLAGLVGAGRSEVARAIFGVDEYDEGTIEIGGQRLNRHRIDHAIQAGVALIPEDRQHEGLILAMSVKENLTLPILNRLSRLFFIDRHEQTRRTRELIKQLDVRAGHIGMAANTLSGGNQQKLVIGKWLATEPRVLILDEPTRGIDVAAKAQVHRWIHDLADQGMATLMISSEIPELISCCDRIVVMCEGRINGELAGNAATEAAILELALPHSATQ